MDSNPRVVAVSSPEVEEILDIEYTYLSSAVDRPFSYQLFTLKPGVGDVFLDGMLSIGAGPEPDKLRFKRGGVDSFDYDEVVVKPGWLWRGVRLYAKPVKVKQTVEVKG